MCIRDRISALAQADLDGKLGEESQSALRSFIDGFNGLDAETQKTWSQAWFGALAGLEGFEKLKDPADVYKRQNLYSSFVKYCNEFDGQIHLCGLSLGGILALNFALDFPQKVKTLVLIGTPYKVPKAVSYTHLDVYKRQG